MPLPNLDLRELLPGEHPETALQARGSSRLPPTLPKTNPVNKFLNLQVKVLDDCPVPLSSLCCHHPLHQGSLCQNPSVLTSVHLLSLVPESPLWVLIFGELLLIL